MGDKTFEIILDDLHKLEYTLRTFTGHGSNLDVRLVRYRELSRESTRKRTWTVDKWYDWQNHRDRHRDNFIPIDRITLPQKIKQAYVEWLIEGITFITKEG